MDIVEGELLCLLSFKNGRSKEINNDIFYFLWKEASFWDLIHGQQLIPWLINKELGKNRNWMIDGKGGLKKMHMDESLVWQRVG